MNADGIHIEINQAEVERQARALAALSVNNPEARKEMRKEIRKILSKLRSNVAKSIHSSLENDPRQAYKAVLHSVWKRVLGGNINILARRKAGARYELIREKKLDPAKPGGNRVRRSSETERMDTYFGADRGFVLRFLNSGTTQRQTRLGNRGSIRATGIFSHTVPWFLNDAETQLAIMVEEELKKYFDEEQNK